MRDEVRASAQGWDALVQETSRYDSPAQYTRRFVATQTRIAGVDLEPGTVLLLVLAAANRDPRANSQPQEFMLERRARPKKVGIVGGVGWPPPVCEAGGKPLGFEAAVQFIMQS
ncbi:MAG: cytochrome P450 [Burkholderiaceae bacterium]